MGTSATDSSGTRRKSKAGSRWFVARRGLAASQERRDSARHLRDFPYLVERQRAAEKAEFPVAQPFRDDLVAAAVEIPHSLRDVPPVRGAVEPHVAGLSAEMFWQPRARRRFVGEVTRCQAPAAGHRDAAPACVSPGRIGLSDPGTSRLRSEGSPAPRTRTFRAGRRRLSESRPDRPGTVRQRPCGCAEAWRSSWDW